MSFQRKTLHKSLQKIAAFLILEAGWITWLLEGFSLGGIAVVLDRAISLVRGTARMGAFQQTRSPRPSDSSSALLLSSSF